MIDFEKTRTEGKRNLELNKKYIKIKRKNYFKIFRLKWLILEFRMQIFKRKYEASKNSFKSFKSLNQKMHPYQYLNSRFIQKKGRVNFSRHVVRRSASFIKVKT